MDFEDAENRYMDIINTSGPVTHAGRMPLEERAKIFLPFAALKGFYEVLHRKEEEHIPHGGSLLPFA